MAIFRLKSGDISAFKLLISLTILYGLMSVLVYSVLHMKFITPLAINAPLNQFSEARALQHLRVLSEDIGGRQEGRPGLKQAADYIKEQLNLLKNRANSNLRIEVEENVVNGTFNMMFLGHSISLAYRAHTNVLMRISSVNTTEVDASVLVNGHFDSALNSPGAADCGSCVASMLELARLIVDSDWISPRPIIFLFNGAEELFMLGSHGFITTHKWRDTIGAFINMEASGNGGPDVVCQSGPGSWASRVYAQSAVYPMALSSAQDVFRIIPGDTDYRIFAQDYGNIPGLDIIFLLGGYFYHTSSDTLERLLPGSIQARGDNLYSVVRAFASSFMLRNSSERQYFESAAQGTDDGERAIFFDYMTWFMVYYSKSVAAVFHSLPVFVFLVAPIILHLANFELRSCLKTYFDFLKGMLQHFIAILMAIMVPMVFAVFRLLFSNHAMNWFANPYLAFMMFVPCSVVGLFVPRYVWRCFYLSEEMSAQKMSREARTKEAGFYGAFGFYALLTMVYTLAGLSGGSLTFFTSMSMLLAWISTQFFSYREHSLRSVVVYMLPLLPCLTYSVYFGGFITQFLIEKMGMMGSIPPPYGYYVPDILVAAMIGVVIGWCVGPLLPIIGDWLGRSSIMKALLQLTVLALAISSGFFPYSVDAPKRVVMQHTILTADSMQVLDSSYVFSVVDSNSLSFLFKYAQEASEHPQIGSEYSFQTMRDRWLALFPVSNLLSRSLKFPVRHEEILEKYSSFPYLSTIEREEISDAGIRKVHLELYLGSLKEVWVTVLNVTGPLSGWSFADRTLPAPETIDGGPPSYICRLSGASYEKWAFWLEANSSEPLRVEVAALDQHLLESAKDMKHRFPEWIDIVAYTSFMSSYTI
ncbi:endoplasmic reticulum metallopeptidase 1-like isoform X1 [Chenopodium quinoa]|uniref:Peptidase M28 domain-containing protein n=2 Tax=Chenopodium quinoa TaxID=63459 RepID=A0A803L168_CHEQI|nr:endoplasmic reticulum metallopeptidase 1-like isoform X1 [Chenopodium quinoa]